MTDAKSRPSDLYKIKSSKSVPAPAKYAAADPGEVLGPNVHRMADFEQHRKPSTFNEWANERHEALIDPRIDGVLHLRQPSDLLALAEAYATGVNIHTGKKRPLDMVSAFGCLALLIAQKHPPPPDFPDKVCLGQPPSDWRDYLQYIPEEMAAVFDAS